MSHQIRSKVFPSDVEEAYREHYFENRPTWDIDRQFGGEAGEVEEYVAPVVDLRIPERAELARLLCDQPPDLSDEEIRERRIRAADLWSGLCKKKEKPKRIPLRLRLSQRPRAVPVKESSPKADPFPLVMRDTQCPDCIGDERLTLEERTFSYCRRPVRNDHFDAEHLKNREHAERRGQLQVCKHPKCRGIEFRNLDHFRNHVVSVHGIPLRTQEQVELRRARNAQRRSRSARHG